MQLVKESILYNCDSRIEMGDNALYNVVGNGTECGLINFLMYSNIEAQELIKEKAGRILKSVPFDSTRKRMTTALQHPTTESLVRVYVKGTPEYILENCVTFLARDGGAEDLDEHKRKQWLDRTIIGWYAKIGLRTIALAYKDYDVDQFRAQYDETNGFEDEESQAQLETDLTFLAAFGLQDDLRPGAEESIRKAQDGQITVRMVSGDNINTAKSVAIKAGILRNEDAEQRDVCMSGEEFRNEVGGLVQTDEGDHFEVANMDRFKHIANKLRVLARATPEDKHTLVVGLKQLGNCVSVTGDGINDVKALKEADVGFAMGSNCEMAKDASDMVLMNDNFAATMDAVSWGRNIFQNIRKFLQFQLTVNVGCLGTIFVSAAIYGESPFSIIQLLWINMIMDTLAALALATEPPAKDAINGKPARSTDPIFSKVMWRQILGVGAYEFIVLIVILLLGPLMFGYAHDFVSVDYYKGNVPTDKVHIYTIMFNTFIFMNIFNFFNCRKLGAQELNIIENFFNNFLFLFIVGGITLAQVFIIL